MLRISLFALLAAALFAQTDTGELRLKVTDQAGLPIPSTIELVSQSNQIRQRFDTDPDGTLVIKRLPFGLYHLQVEHAGFARLSNIIEVRSALRKDVQVTLGVAPIETVVTVTESATLIDPYSTGSSNRIGAAAIEDRAATLPGRSLLDLIDNQPGWLLEANGILHPRGSEYQTQYVVDGMPLTENRSPAFSPELEADTVQSMNVLTAGYPAEYGRKLGGVVEVNTLRDSRLGFHGKAIGTAGSFDSLGSDLVAQYGWRHDTLTFSGGADRTDRYLDPPVLENYTNAGTIANLAAEYERDLTNGDRLGVIVRNGQSRFEVPNEIVQQQAGQRQDRDAAETAGQAFYQHVFSPSIVGNFRGMVRDLSADLWSNPNATPIFATQSRGLREGYVKATLSGHFGRHEWKAGADGDFGSISEAFSYRITDRSQFDPETRRRFTFSDRAQDREQSAFAQDLIRLGNWTVSAGLRWDHYRLIVDQNAVSPRLGLAWYWPAADLVVRASYDRIFQTPAFENLLLASSTAVATLNDSVLRLPVRPSHGNYYQGGFAKGFFKKLRLDANYYVRSADNFADDDLLLNTGVSFPIAFRKAEIHGVEVKLEIPRWGPLSGFVSYSNMLGVGYFPVTGGLFLGDESAGLLSSTDRFPISQDQRNTVRARFRYQAAPRLWFAFGGAYGSGLPVEFDGTYRDALAQYGSAIVNQVNFDRGRLRPNFSLNASVGVTVWKNEKRRIELQADVQNLTDRLNVINFSGLFSGTAVGEPRSAAGRVKVEF